MPNESMKVIEESFQERELRFKKELARAKKEINADILHDLRVSIRRLQAVLLLLRLLPQTKVKKSIYQRPKIIMDPLGELRDIFVEVAILKDVFQRKNSFVKLFLKRLKRNIEQEEENVRNAVKSFSVEFLEKLDVEKTLFHLADTDLEYQIKIVLVALFKEFFSFGEEAKAGNINVFHSMRISLKKLRYICEIFSSIFPGITEIILNNMHILQQVMGDIRDLDLLIQKIRNLKIKGRKLTHQKALTSDRLNEMRASLFDKEFKERLEVIFSYEKDFTALVDIVDGRLLF